MIWPRLCLVLVLCFVPISAAEKSPSSNEKQEGKVKPSSESRNGELLDQIAEESRIAEVESAEKSYANSGPLPPPPPVLQGPPPIPVPVPVKVRPGALVLPSPGSGGRKGGSKQPSYESQGGGPYKPPPHPDMVYENAQSQTVQLQSQALPLQQGNGGGGMEMQATGAIKQRNPPLTIPAHQGEPQMAGQGQRHVGGLQPPGPYPQHQGMPPHAKQQFLQQSGQGQIPPQAKHQAEMLAQLQGLLPHLGLGGPPQPGSQQKLEHGLLYGGPILGQGPPPPPPRHGPQPSHKNPAIVGDGHPQVVELAAQQSHPLPHIGESEVGVVPVGGHFSAFPQLSNEPWPHSSPELPQIVHLEAKCEKNAMKVAIKFDKPFFGVIFSKQHYDNANCVYVRPGHGHSSATFAIAINGCGTFGNTQNGLYGYGEQTGSGSYFENTIIIQYDPFVQEVWDQARKLRCSWHDYYEKAVTFKPFNVEMLDIVHTDFAGDNVGCWMQIQEGKGPWANEVTGIVKIGQTLTMVLAIKDEEKKFDMLVRDCVAHDGKRNPIQLVDDRGCTVRPSIMSKFIKIKNFDPSASVMSYAYFQAFKFPDSMDVHFQCTIQICRYQCPEQCALPIDGPARGGETVVSETLRKPAVYAQGGRPRLERATFRIRRAAAEAEDSSEPTPTKAKDIGVNGNIKVVSTGDLAFSLDNSSNSNTATVVYPLNKDHSGMICISTPSFTITLIFLLAILVISCIVSTFLCLRHRPTASSAESSSASVSGHVYKSKPSFYGFLRWNRY